MSSEMKRGLGIDVLTAARQRIAFAFDNFPKIYVSFSGGKDSGVMLHLVMEEATRRGRKVGVLFIDWEAQYQLTIDFVQSMFNLYAPHIEPYWVALPLLTTNAVSMIEPEWMCWEPGKEELWVRRAPSHAITSPDSLPFHYPGITFEEFIEKFGHWYGGCEPTMCFVGIRAGESLNRWRAVACESRTRFMDCSWTVWKLGAVFNGYPIYDWRTQDVWTYTGKFRKPYNPIYDRMHQAGLSIHQSRICEPYGDEQRRGLWLFHVIEPDTWARVAARVAGANSGALYAGEKGNVLGNIRVTLPPGHTWKSFAEFILATMPQKTAEHYRNKIAVWLQWYCNHGGYPGGDIPDELPDDTGTKDKPSWRRVCKVLLKNDYWCKGLCFSPTKSKSYEKYLKIMRKRRGRWNLI